MSTYQPRTNIPDSWAQIGACPICNSRGLSVTRVTGHPDQMTCPKCQASFELEVDGPNIRLMVLPASHAAYLQPAWQTWMSVYEINRQIKSGMELHPEGDRPTSTSVGGFDSHLPANIPSSISVSAPNLFDDMTPLEPLTQEEVVTRAIGLANLGNTPREIRSTLERFNATPDQISAALAEIDQRKKGRKSNTPRTLFIVILAVLVCLGLTALLLPLLNIPGVIRTVAPYWNTLQKSLTQDDIYGGVTGGSGQETPLPTQAAGSLRFDDQQYFNSIWSVNQKTNWYDKYSALNQLFPPLALLEVHNAVLSRYLQMAVLEAAQEGNQPVLDELCASSRAANGNLCSGVDNIIFVSAQYLKLQNEMVTWWTSGPCEKFREFYRQQQVPFPYPEGTCSAP